MSAYMLDDDAIHRLVIALKVEGFFAGRDPTELGDALLQMNEAAVNARYNESSRRNEPYVFAQPPVFSAMQAYKTIRCYLYQCSEGEVPTWKLFGEVDAVRQFYADLLGHDAKADRWSTGRRAAEYSEAEWG
jgi:hypothetical protein